MEHIEGSYNEDNNIDQFNINDDNRDNSHFDN